MSTYSILALTGALLLLGAISNKISSKANMPILLVFLAIGAATAEFGFIPEALFTYGTTRAINLFGTVAMCFILFSGGLNTRFSSMRGVLLPGSLLASVGVVTTALVFGSGCYVIQRTFGRGNDFAWCLLIGALVSSTDAAAVMSVLRSRNTALRGNLQPLLELESGSNDPAAYLLTIILLGIARSGSAPSFWGIALELAGKVFWGLTAGALAGVLFGAVAQWIYNTASRKKVLEYEGLYFVIGIAVVLLTFGLTEKYLRGNGLMAVYTCGIMMGNVRFTFKKALTQFNEGVSWLMQVSLFTVLGFLVSPEELIRPAQLIDGLLLAALLMFVARPLAVWTCLIGSKFTARERLFVSWVGLRGAAPIMLATFPLAAGIPDAGIILNMVFFIVLASIVVQGSTLMQLARLLGLACSSDDRARAPLELEITDERGDSEMFEFEVPAEANFVGRSVAELGLPAGALILLVRREGKFFPPRGDSRIEAGDGMLIMGRGEVMAEVNKNFFPEADYHPVRTLKAIRRSYPMLSSHYIRSKLEKVLRRTDG